MLRSSEFIDNTTSYSLECPVCLEVKESLHTLKCKHSICLSCIINIYKKNDRVDCPICRDNKIISTINNVYFLQDIGLFDSSNIFTPFNTSKYKAEMNIKENERYIIILPQKNILLLVKCIFKALNAADMIILNGVKDNKYLTAIINCGISYNYSNYNKIYFESFSQHDDCLIYI